MTIKFTNPFQAPPKFTQIFGVQKYHLATLLPTWHRMFSPIFFAYGVNVCLT
jgi:hypothetical protein